MAIDNFQIRVTTRPRQLNVCRQEQYPNWPTCVKENLSFHLHQFYHVRILHRCVSKKLAAMTNTFPHQQKWQTLLQDLKALFLIQDVDKTGGPEHRGLSDCILPLTHPASASTTLSGRPDPKLICTLSIIV